jgi:murein DD-endopeptidase MepM/ murein hydrolase activator NlpD
MMVPRHIRVRVGLVAAVAIASVISACGPVTQPITNAYPNAAGADEAPRRTLGDSYVVEAGDTVYGIARRADLGVRAVIEANGLTPPYIVVPGQRLALPRLREHVVAAGDTVYGVARRYDVSMSALVRANAVEPPYTIWVGQRLVLPGQVIPAPGSMVAVTPVEQSGGEVTTAPLSPVLPTESTQTTQPTQPTQSGQATESTPSIPAPDVTRPTPPSHAAIAPPPRTEEGFLWPVEGKILSRFGSKAGGLHNDGINIAAARGTPVYAAENGVVVYAGNELRGFGNLLLLRHADGWVTAYAHNDQFLVRRGDRVTRGQKIATVGSTGSVSTPQLHFEIRKGSRPMNPIDRLPDRQVSTSLMDDSRLAA